MSSCDRRLALSPTQPISFIDLKSQYAELKGVIGERIQRVLDHGQYIMGPEVAELESALTSFAGTRNCVTVASGTEALLISLMALGVGRGDEVITTPFSFVATVEVIVRVGATPVFVDVKADTGNLDASLVADAVTPRTKAILPVSLYGQVADMDEINEIARRNGDLAVIEDAAQSFGAEYRGRRSCNLSVVGCTSFFPSKPLGCYGDGGAIFTNDDTLAQAMREIRVHGQALRYQHDRIGVGGRMDTLQCAVVLAKLDLFNEEIAQRRSVAARYTRLLEELLPHVRPMSQLPDRESVFAQYTIRASARDRLIGQLKNSGIPTAIHYPQTLNRQPAYKQYAPGSHFPVAETLSREVVSLPMHPWLDEATQQRIASVVRCGVGVPGETAPA